MDTVATHPNPRTAAGAAGPGSGRSIAGLFSDLWRETTTLVHEEAELAKADVTEKVSQAVNGVAAVAVGGAIVFAGFLALLLAAINALMPFLPPDMAPWLSPLIVGLVVMIVGYISLSSGKAKFKARNLTPSRSAESLRQTGNMLKEHAR